MTKLTVMITTGLGALKVFDESNPGFQAGRTTANAILPVRTAAESTTTTMPVNTFLNTPISARGRWLLGGGFVCTRQTQPRDFAMMAGMPLFAHAGREEKLTPPPLPADAIESNQVFRL